MTPTISHLTAQYNYFLAIRMALTWSVNYALHYPLMKRIAVSHQILQMKDPSEQVVNKHIEANRQIYCGNTPHLGCDRDHENFFKALAKVNELREVLDTIECC